MALWSLVLMCSYCSKDEESTTPENAITVQQTTDVTENSFIINWTTNVSDINSINILLALDDSFSQLEGNIPVNDPGKTNQLVNGLVGATRYYIKMVIELSGGTTLESNVIITATEYQDMPISFTTEDGLNITGRIKYRNSDIGERPAIIFMHQYKSLGNQWNGSDLERKCVSEGWVCLLINFRGHFGSDPWDVPPSPTLEGITEYQEVLGYDVTAAVEFVKSNPIVDPEKLALLGASLGANMSLEGNCQVLTSVAFTPSLVIPNTLCSGSTLQSVFYIVGEFDKAGDIIDFCKDTKVHYNNTLEPKKLIVVPESQSHGWNLLTASIEDQVIEWLDVRFTE